MKRTPAMTILYDRIIELLGKSTDDDLSRSFVVDLGEEPRYSKSKKSYIFSNFGFELICITGLARWIFVAAIFWTEGGNPTGSVQVSKTYTGTLPAGILPTDTKEEVEHKLDSAPVRGLLQKPTEQDRFEAYDQYRYPYPPYQLEISFYVSNGLMRSIAVMLDPENLETLLKAPM